LFFEILYLLYSDYLCNCHCRALASQLVDDHRPGDFNQALMELGATICTPTSPSCTSCPISSQCTALKLVNVVEKKVASVTCFPTKVPKSAPREEYVAVCIVERVPQTKTTKAASSLLLVQRPLKGLLAGLWEFPSAPLGTPDSSEDSRLTAMDE
jgi:A/G-specific adenine glycosylase